MPDMQDRDAPLVFHVLIDAYEVVVTRQDLAHAGHSEPGARYIGQLLLEGCSVEWKILRVGRAATVEVERIPTQEILLPLLQIAEPDNVSSAARQPACFSAARLRNHTFDDVLGI